MFATSVWKETVWTGQKLENVTAAFMKQILCKNFHVIWNQHIDRARNFNKKEQQKQEKENWVICNGHLINLRLTIHLVTKIHTLDLDKVKLFGPYRRSHEIISNESDDIKSPVTSNGR